MPAFSISAIRGLLRGPIVATIFVFRSMRVERRRSRRRFLSIDIRAYGDLDPQGETGTAWAEIHLTFLIMMIHVALMSCIPNTTLAKLVKLGLLPNAKHNNSRGSMPVNKHAALFHCMWGRIASWHRFVLHHCVSSWVSLFARFSGVNANIVRWITIFWWINSIYR